MFTAIGISMAALSCYMIKRLYYTMQDEIDKKEIVHKEIVTQLQDRIDELEADKKEDREYIIYLEKTVADLEDDVEAVVDNDDDHWDSYKEDFNWSDPYADEEPYDQRDYD